MIERPLELVPDEYPEDPSQQKNWVGAGGMVCEPCNIALIAKRTGYIASLFCPQCGGGLKLRALL